MNHKNWMALATAVAAGAVASGAAFAGPVNDPPPSGAILDLGGGETGTAALPVNLVIGDGPSDILPGATPALASVDFTASVASTDIALAMRDDPAGVIVWNVGVTDLTHPGGNLLVNGNFSSGLSSWTLLNPDNTGSVITAYSGCGSFSGLSTTCVAAGNDGAYDTIDQEITATVGDVYQLSFYYGASQGSPVGIGLGSGYFSDLSTNGLGGGAGNAIDILGYATPVPLPPSFGLVGLGLAVLLWPTVIRRGARPLAQA